MCTTSKTEKLKMLEKINEVVGLQIQGDGGFDPPLLKEEMLRAFAVGDYALLANRVEKFELEHEQEAEKLFRIRVFIQEYETAEALNRERIHGTKKDKTWA